MTKRQVDFSRLRLLITDVDGVMTDGGIIIHTDGTESKRFHVLDGHRIMMWHRAGLDSAILSGRDTPATTLRAQQLDIRYVLQGHKEKLPAFEQLLVQTGLTAEQTIYIGDDWMDLPLIRRAGFSVLVANAAEELKPYADYVTQRCGGGGAVAEVVEFLLRKTGRWDELIQRYQI